MGGGLRVFYYFDLLNQIFFVFGDWSLVAFLAFLRFCIQLLTCEGTEWVLNAGDVDDSGSDRGTEPGVRQRWMEMVEVKQVCFHGLP